MKKWTDHERESSTIFNPDLWSTHRLLSVFYSSFSSLMIIHLPKRGVIHLRASNMLAWRVYIFARASLAGNIKLRKSRPLPPRSTINRIAERSIRARARARFMRSPRLEKTRFARARRKSRSQTALLNNVGFTNGYGITVDLVRAIRNLILPAAAHTRLTIFFRGVLFNIFRGVLFKTRAVEREREREKKER